MAFYSLILTFVLIYDRPGSLWPVIHTAKLGTIIPIVVFVISFFVKSNITHGEIWGHKNTKWLLYFMFLILVSLAVIQGPDALERLKLVVGNFFLYISVCRIVDTKQKLKGIFLTLGFCHILLIFLNPDLILDPTTRTYVAGMTFLGDGNDFGLSLCILFPLALYNLLDAEKRYPRLLYLAIMLFTALAVVGTQSRGASLALGAVLGYMWLKSKAKIFGIIALGVLMVAALLFASPQYFARMGTIAHYSHEGSAEGRIHAWKRAMYLGSTRPILGVGAGNFGRYNNNLTAHSMYFLALGELGIPGAIFIVAYMIQNMRRARKRLKEIDKEGEFNQSYRRLFVCLNAAFLGFAIAGAFLSVLYYPHIFVLGALLFVAERVYEQDAKEKRAELEEDKVYDKNIGHGERKQFSYYY